MQSITKSIRLWDQQRLCTKMCFGVDVDWSLVFCVMFWRSLFVLLSLFLLSIVEKYMHVGIISLRGSLDP
jgi:hypothetical protein